MRLMVYSNLKYRVGNGDLILIQVHFQKTVRFWGMKAEMCNRVSLKKDL
jgi:hypothetical protein